MSNQQQQLDNSHRFLTKLACRVSKNIVDYQCFQIDAGELLDHIVSLLASGEEDALGLLGDNSFSHKINYLVWSLLREHDLIDIVRKELFIAFAENRYPKSISYEVTIGDTPNLERLANFIIKRPYDECFFIKSDEAGPNANA